jgi:cell wall-associated NlpC family hydrolase
MIAARVGVPVTAVWRHPDATSRADAPITRPRPDAGEWVDALDDDAKLGLETRLDTQALLGEPVLVVGQSGEWSNVRLPWQPSSRGIDGYPGWIPSAHLLQGAGDQPARPDEGAVVTERVAQAMAEDGETIPLSFGTVLGVVDASAGTVRHPDGRVLRVKPEEISASRERRGSDLVGSALRFVGLPYLWGGVSGHGVDCSGLVHLCHRAAGRIVPRDAHDQSLHGRAVPDPDIRPGDSVYFENLRGVHHTGFALADSRLLHAPTTGQSVRYGSVVDDYPGELRGFRRFGDAVE